MDILMLVLMVLFVIGMTIYKWRCSVEQTYRNRQEIKVRLDDAVNPTLFERTKDATSISEDNYEEQRKSTTTHIKEKPNNIIIRVLIEKVNKFVGVLKRKLMIIQYTKGGKLKWLNYQNLLSSQGKS